VFFTVLPALVLWFVLLSAAYRFRLLDRALGLAQQPVDAGVGRS
jgi:cation-transporting P-type ATPase E